MFLKFVLTLMVFLIVKPELSAQYDFFYKKKMEKEQEKKEKKKEKIHYWQVKGFKEEFVDDDNKIYFKRLYQGIIPHLRDTIPTLRVPKKKNKVVWIGYQHKRLYSRVFIKTNHPADFVVYQKSPKHIVIKIKHTTFLNSNVKRAIYTYNFNTKIKSIVPVQGKGRVAIIHIYLKEPAGFLYKQDENYIFIDIEKSVTK